MALRQTYLSMKSRLPPDSDVVLVMRSRGNDELAPSKELFDEFTALKKGYAPDSGFESAVHYAWARSDFAERFLEQIRGDERAMARLRELSEQARIRDVFLVCYEGHDKPCHRHLLLEIAEEELGADVNPARFLPDRP